MKDLSDFCMMENEIRGKANNGTTLRFSAISSMQAEMAMGWIVSGLSVQWF